MPIPISQHSPQSHLDDFGLGFFGQGVFTLKQNLDITAGARVDYENKNATLNTFFNPAIAPPTIVDEEANFTEVSPQFAVAYRLQPEHTVYASVSRGFKAGGFNAASLPGSEAYGEEHTWNLEGGVKTTWADGRVSANAAVFYIDWDDLQLNVPNPFVPAQFYIANVGSAKSKGVELELNARAAPGVDLFGGVGYTHARFGDNSRSSGVDVSGNKLPEHARLHDDARRPVFPRALVVDDDVWTWGGGVLRRVPIRRPEPRRAGRLFAGQFPRRRARKVLLRGPVDPQRVRHQIHSDRVLLRQLRALRLRRRNGRAADVRPDRGGDVLILQDTRVGQYRADGFVIVRNVFSADEAAALDSEANRVFGLNELKDTNNIRCRR